jgi:hypothetical protein
MEKETIHHGDFSLADIIGAVVGTFLLTLLACIAVFHVVNRRFNHNLICRWRGRFRCIDNNLIPGIFRWPYDI